MSATSLPPGLEGDLVEANAGGSGEWAALKTRKSYTNAFVFDPTGTKMLLGLKKRGFGVGLYNGFGGKVDPGETPAEAAKRELKEEAGIDAPLEHCGSLLFILENGPEWAFQIELYRSSTFSGEITETDEMRPMWFSTSSAVSAIESAAGGLPAIPYAQMWQDDIYWMPLMLAGKPFVGRADFTQDPAEPGEYKIRKWWFGVPPAYASSK
ncbi:hypothetical protein PENSPDRAFT_679939 [Peniophora sp. CONT]|nr:hypothetical protein PENSPDRAFT_679939 [Peniophora sp. CONT]